MGLHRVFAYMIPILDGFAQDSGACQLDNGLVFRVSGSDAESVPRQEAAATVVEPLFVVRVGSVMPEPSTQRPLTQRKSLRFKPVPSKVLGYEPLLWLKMIHQGITDRT